MFHEMTIAGVKRQLPLCKVTDDLYIAAFIMFSERSYNRTASTGGTHYNGVDINFKHALSSVIQGQDG